MLLQSRIPGSILLALLCGAAPFTPGRYEFTQVHMGLPVRLVLHADEATARRAATAAFTRIASLDRMMSDYRPDSELSELNMHAGEWYRVSDALFDVARRTIEIARLTDGAFDPTVGPLVTLWRDARRSQRLPPPEAIAAARTLVGWQRLDVDADRRRLRLAPGMRLDLGGIAKGYILQEALRTLAARGVTRALVEAGGDIVVGDAPPGREGWRIETGVGGAFGDRAARLTHAALATSGPTAQFVEIGGVRHSHVIDPRRGIGVTHDLVAHVIAPDGATADALATAASVMGPEAATRMASRLPRIVVSFSR